MTARFSEALRLLWRHLGLFAAIILTVALPGMILGHYVDPKLKASSYGVVVGVEEVFGPIYIGALVYALFQIKSGHIVSYKEAIRTGFMKWGSLFAARLVASILIALGFIALVIPGIVLAVQYSFLDPAVVIEGRGPLESRARSIELTAGQRWQIFWAAVLFFVPFFVILYAIHLPLRFIEALNIMPVEVVLGCILYIAYAVIQIVVFLFYWEATQNLRLAEPLAAPNGGPATQLGNSGITEGPPSVS